VVVPPDEPLTPPAYLSDAALDVWHDVVPQLAALGTASRVDSAAVATYCVLQVEFSRLAMEAPGGAAGARALRQQATILRLWAREIGLTPSSRQSLEGTRPGSPSEQRAEYLLNWNRIERAAEDERAAARDARAARRGPRDPDAG
jgi:phage terminase small subunit